MKKSLIALAALAATGAFAQSSVTLSGQLDVGYQKAIGSAADAAQTETHGSRVRLLGTEDLGGGLKASFNLEHRLNLKNGGNSGFAASAPTNGLNQDTFWNGTSTVGLSGSFGTVDMGRQYTAGFISANNKADPFGGDGVGALRGVGMRTTNNNGTLRVAQSIGYKNSFGPVSLHVTSGDEIGTGATQRALGYAIGFTQGAISAGFGKDSGAMGDEVTNAYAGYNFGFANVTLGYGKTGGSLAKTTGMLVGVTVPVAGGTVKAGYATAENAAGVKTNNKFGVGYSYDLSKRTRIDLTAGNDSKLTANKSGYDVTLTHSF